MQTILIAGGSASGKSTLAELLSERLSADRRVAMIAMDSFYKSEADLPLVTVANGNTYRDYNAPASFDLVRMHETIAAAKDDHDIVIVEGLLTLDKTVVCCEADLRVFVDCPADVRFARRIKRNLSWGLSAEDIINVYVDLVRYRHEKYVEPTKANADLVVDTTHGTDEALTVILRGLHKY